MITQTKLDRLSAAVSTLVRGQGIAAIHNAARFRGLLKDELAGELGPQVDLLVGAIDAGVVAEIVEHRGVPAGERAAVSERLAQAVGAADAPWVLDVWLRGLNMTPATPTPPIVTGPAMTGTVVAGGNGAAQTRVAQSSDGPAETPVPAKVPVAALAGGALVLVLGAVGLGFGYHHAHATTPVAIVSPGALHNDQITDDAGVARVSYARGDVGIRRADDQNDLLAAAPNAPLFAGDQLATATSADAEAHLSQDWVIRLGEQSQVRFEDLQPGSREVQLARGEMELRVFGHAQNGPPQVDTPSVSIVPVDAGAYRVDVTPDGRTVIAVASGRAQVILPQGDQYVNAGQTATVTGSPANPQIAFSGALPDDAFNQFNTQRDATYAAMVAQPNDGAGGDGVAELASYGRWVDTPNYGRVWVPAESPQWTPYSQGHWAWTEDYGWTWIADEPWGWAPYHYGRWYNDPGVGWAWVPGPPAAAWQPAQVALFVAAGALAWVALAPGEAYHPWYGSGGSPAPVVYDRRVGFLAYHNARDIRAVRTFELARIARGDFGRTAYVHTADLHRYALLRGGVPVIPERGALRYAGHNVAGIRPVAAGAFAGHAMHGRNVAFAGERAAVERSIHGASHGPARIAAHGGPHVTAHPAGRVAHVVPHGAGPGAHTVSHTTGGARVAHVTHVTHATPRVAQRTLPHTVQRRQVTYRPTPARPAQHVSTQHAPAQPRYAPAARHNSNPFSHVSNPFNHVSNPFSHVKNPFARKTQPSEPAENPVQHNRTPFDNQGGSESQPRSPFGASRPASNPFAGRPAAGQRAPVPARTPSHR